MKQLKRETIQKLHELTNSVATAEAHASELLRTAQDRYNHVEHEVEREDPKSGERRKVTVSRKVLWDEVFYLGTGSDAATILKAEHPEVFDAYKVQETAAGDLQRFVVAEMGMDMKKMRVSDYVKLTEAIVDLRLDERENGIKSPIQKI